MKKVMLRKSTKRKKEEEKDIRIDLKIVEEEISAVVQILRGGTIRFELHFIEVYVSLVFQTIILASEEMLGLFCIRKQKQALRPNVVKTFTFSCDAKYLPKPKRVYFKMKKKCFKSWVFILFSTSVYLILLLMLNSNLYWHLPATPCYRLLLIRHQQTHFLYSFFCWKYKKLVPYFDISSKKKLYRGSKVKYTIKEEFI